MTDYDKKLKRNINDIKRGVKNLKLLGLKIKIDEVEGLMGKSISNIYVVDYSYPGSGGNNGKQKIILQKHLFTV